VLLTIRDRLRYKSELRSPLHNWVRLALGVEASAAAALPHSPSSDTPRQPADRSSAALAQVCASAQWSQSCDPKGTGRCVYSMAFATRAASSVGFPRSRLYEQFRTLDEVVLSATARDFAARPTHTLKAQEWSASVAKPFCIIGGDRRKSRRRSRKQRERIGRVFL
jgi:hypothetical protein